MIIKGSAIKYILFASFFTILVVFNSIKSYANEGNIPPKGFIESPVNGSTIKGELVVSGWFLDANGVSKIEVLVDGVNMGIAQYGEPRPDVLSVYPEYQNPSSGFKYSINTKNLTNGQHTITVKETGNDGTVNLETVNVNVQNPPAKGFIDSPIAGSIIKGEVNVRGWFLDTSGVSEIEVLVDGKSMGAAQYGEPRPDVQSVYPEYQNPNSGFKSIINTKNLTNGQHTITVKETGKNGAVNLETIKVNVQNPPAKGFIDAPVNGSTIKGELAVRGWFLDVSGVSKIEVLVDGKSMGTAQYGEPRPDVQRFYPEYQNPNSGYNFTLNTKNLTNGQHNLTIKETGNNGAITNLESMQINVENPPAKGFIDTPMNGSTIKGDLHVRGWFLDVSGVSKIEVLVDGKIMGAAQYGESRPDVQSFFPEYQNRNSGYNFTLNTKDLTNGQHNVTIRETGNNGATTTLDSIKINIDNPPPIGFIDNPKNGSTVKGDLLIRGWFLDLSGVSKIELLVDGLLMGTAQYGEPRPDVQSFFPVYQNSNSGFNMTFDTRKLINGQHTLTIRETGRNGAIKQESVNVNVQNLQSVGYIDSPVSGTPSNGEILVRGWYLDVSGVSKIEVFVDGAYMGQAQYGIARPDVLQVLPEYQNGYSGYQFTLNTSQFSQGEHTVTIKETGNNGSTSSLSSKFIVGNPYLYVDLRKPSNITANDIINFFNAKRPDSPLKNYAQGFIDAQNKYGVNAQYLVAHAIWETGWGGSNLISFKNNLYGYGAYNPCPFTCGYYFPSVQDSINFVSYTVRKDYLTESGAYYNGPNLIGMNVRYASDQNWKNGIANLMQSIKTFDSAYYSQVGIYPGSSAAPPSIDRNIPVGKLYPTDIIINYPMGKTATVTTNGLSFRSIPYLLSSTLISTLSAGTVVQVLGYNKDVRYEPGVIEEYPYDNLWYRVKVNGREGWLYGGGIVLNN